MFFSTNYITITKAEEEDWANIKPRVIEAIMNFYASGAKIIDEKAIQPDDTKIQDDDDEVIIAIKELLDTKIRPYVQGDGGDIEFKEFKDGKVYIKLQGACSTCSSSTITLKGFVENMMRNYIPEVESVEQVEEEND